MYRPESVPVVYYIPENLPTWIAERLAKRYGARPGDAILHFPGEDPPYTLQRDFGGVAAVELQRIIPCLSSPCHEPRARPFHGVQSGRQHLQRVK